MSIRPARPIALISTSGYVPQVPYFVLTGVLCGLTHGIFSFHFEILHFIRLRPIVHGTCAKNPPHRKCGRRRSREGAGAWSMEHGVQQLNLRSYQPLVRTLLLKTTQRSHDYGTCGEKMASVISLGPLTTTFTPPPECSSVNLYFDSVLGVVGNWGEECPTGAVPPGSTGIFASSCYPDGWAEPFTSNYRRAPDEFAAFSPGLHCPRGWTTACSVARTDDAGPNGADRTMWSVLEDGQTAIGCCPS